MLPADAVPLRHWILAPWLALVGCAAGVGAQTAPLSWRQLPQSSAASAAMVFDSVRGRFVLFGRGTWEWDGTNWRERHTTHRPNAQGSFGLAFDSARGRTVLFGGYVGFDPVAELWEYDGEDWTQRSVAGGPPARGNPSMTYDSLRGQVVLFGGYGLPISTSLGDTWTWNGTTWAQVPGVGPQPGQATMAFHAASGSTVLLGWSGVGLTSQTWLFDGVTWQPQTPNHAPPLQTGPQVAWYDPTSSSVRVLGGVDSTVWEWSGSDWSAFAGPARVRGGPAVACDPRGTTLVTGGLGFVVVGIPTIAIPFGDTWQLQGTTWTLLHDTGPDAADMLLAHDFGRDSVLCTCMTTVDRRTFTWSAGEWREDQAARLPRLFGVGMSHDLFRGRFVQFGGGSLGFGFTSPAPTTDLFEYDGTRWTQVFAVGPSARSKHAMAFDFVRGQVLMFGGNDGINTLGDTWFWNGTSWQFAFGSGPPARFAAAAATDLLRAQVVLFGGNTGTGILNDTWLWNGVAWRQVASTVRPPARLNAALAFDLAHRRTILCGGQPNGGTTFRDQWAWDGSTWSQLADGVTEKLTAQDRSAITATSAGMLRVVNGATWFGSDVVASTSMIGAGCGNPAPALISFGEPVLGTTAFAVDLERAGAGAPFALAFGHGSGSVQLGSGCALLMPAIDLTVIGTADSRGRATYPLPVPAQPALRDLTLTLQGGVLQSAAPLGFALSNALTTRIGD